MAPATTPTILAGINLSTSAMFPFLPYLKIAIRSPTITIGNIIPDEFLPPKINAIMATAGIVAP